MGYFRLGLGNECPAGAKKGKSYCENTKKPATSDSLLDLRDFICLLLKILVKKTLYIIQPLIS